MENRSQTEIAYTENDNDNRRDMSRSLHRYNPKHNPEEFLVLVAVALISIGLAVVCAGYIVPRGYQFDPSIPAREMEQIEIHYATLAYHLDVMIVVGMGCIAVGGLIATGIAIHNMLSAKPRVYRQKDRRDISLLTQSNESPPTYGTAESQ